MLTYIKDNPRIYGKNNVLNEAVKCNTKHSVDVVYIDKNISEEDAANIYKCLMLLCIPMSEGFVIRSSYGLPSSCCANCGSNR